MRVRLMVLLLLLAFASAAWARVSLKPGPQLWVYSTNGDLASVKALVKANPFDKEILGRAMYHVLRRGNVAKSEDNLAILRLLLSHGADVNLKSLNGQTPLIAAVIGQNEAAVRLFLENGAAVEYSDFRNRKAADYAKTSPNPAIAELLKNPPPPNPIQIIQPGMEPKVLNLDMVMEKSEVQITFDLIAQTTACVKLIGSLDKGVTYAMKFNGATGDVGNRVSPGQARRIVWNLSVDYPNGLSDADVLIDVVAESCP